MMKRVIVPVLCAAALAGCSPQKFADGIDTINTALTSPKAQQAIANLQKFGQVVTCTFASIDANAISFNNAIAPLIASKRATTVISDATKGLTVAYVGNAVLCQQFGGSPAVITAATVSTAIKTGG